MPADAHEIRSVTGIITSVIGSGFFVAIRGSIRSPGCGNFIGSEDRILLELFPSDQQEIVLFRNITLDLSHQVYLIYKVHFFI